MATVTLTISVAVIKQPQYLGSGAVTTNKVSMGDLKNVYGGNTSPKLSDYYAGGVFVPKPPPTSAAQNGPIPENGNISLGKFLQTTNEYFGTIEYPIVSRAGSWRFYLPKLPSGWPTAKLDGRLIGGGGGGGGGWGNAAPNGGTPVAAGGGGGSGTDIDLLTLNASFTDSQLTKRNQSTPQEAGYFDLIIGGGGGGSWLSTDWQDGRETESHPGGNGGFSYINRYDITSQQSTNVATAPGGNGGTGGTYGWSGQGYTPGGGNGGNGEASRGVGGDRRGGAGGGNSLGAGGAGGFGGWGSSSTTPGAGGGGGGARDINADAAAAWPAGNGAAGYGRIILRKGT